MRGDRSSACEPWACRIHCAGTARIIPALAAACFSLPFARRSFGARAPCGLANIGSFAASFATERGANGVTGYFLALHSIELAIAAIDCGALPPRSNRVRADLSAIGQPASRTACPYGRRTTLACHAVFAVSCQSRGLESLGGPRSILERHNQMERTAATPVLSPSPRVARRAYAGSEKPG
jgi:hypothetical protein